MSTAEITAHKIYKAYNLGALPQDVKRHLMIMFLNEASSDSVIPSDDYSTVDTEELQTRAHVALDQISAGEGRPIKELFDEVDSLYSWLCK